jgi:hypothetical protein
MTQNLHALTPDRYANQCWIRPTQYTFAALDAVAPLVVRELSKALMHLPIGFITQADTFSLVAIQGLQPGQNLCVAPNGRWLVGYIPAVYRSYPFAAARAADGTQVLCFDENSGLLTQSDGEAFYDVDGELTQNVREIVEFFGEVTQNRSATERICAALQRHQLIQPWQIKIQDDAGEHVINGLYQVDEAALNALSPVAFQELRETGALPVAYCQLLSMQHVQRLAELAKAHQKAAAIQAKELDQDFLVAESGSLNFS